MSTIRIITPPAELPEGGDAFDFIEARDSMDSADIAANVVAMGDAAQPYHATATTTDTTLTATTTLTHSLIVKRASDVVVRPLTWFWPNVFVGGALNLLLGMPDVGKSVLTIDLAARTTNGTPWPPLNGQQAPNIGGSVAFLSMEDSPETTIVPRLMAAGADLSKVLIVEGVTRTDGKASFRDSFDIAADVGKLEQLRAENPDLRLVVIDPLDSYLNAKLDTNIGNKVRAALWPLKDWAEQSGVTIIIVHHFNKSVTTNAMDKVSGARSFGALPRSVWAVAREDGDERTIMAPIKLNLVSREDRHARAYTIKGSQLVGGQPVVAWSDESVDTTANELLGGTSNRTDEAADWLREVLADGPVDSKDMQGLADKAGHAWRTIQRAKERAKVQVLQSREGDRITGWHWTLTP
jgi:putative DNA primase/helicase